MLEERALVIEVKGAGVLVETVRQSACASCSASKGCGQKLLSDLGQGARFQVLARNPRSLILQQGDSVVLGLEESSFLTASLMLYLLPLFAMMVLALVADWAALPEPLVILAGLGGLLGGLLVVRRWSAGVESGCRYQPEILRRAA